MKTVIETDLGASRVRANYTLQVDEPAKLIRIVDQDLGEMSVTNDLEAVLCDVARQIDDTLDNYIITYRDSTGIWDRIVVTPHDVLAHTFDVEVLPGPEQPFERRDPMATS